MNVLPYAEKAPYWKTGKSTSPGGWLDKAARHIEKYGGRVLIKAEGMDPRSGRQAYMLAFEMDGDNFRAVWPVLPVRHETKTSENSARVQASTLLYHDIKEKCNAAFVLGARAAFFPYLLLPDGRTAAEVSVPEIIPTIFPLMLSEGENDKM